MDPMENETINDDTAPLLPRETSFIDEITPPPPVKPKTTTDQRVELTSGKMDQLYEKLGLKRPHDRDI